MSAVDDISKVVSLLFFLTGLIMLNFQWFAVNRINKMLQSGQDLLDAVTAFTEDRIYRSVCYVLLKIRWPMLTAGFACAIVQGVRNDHDTPVLLAFDVAVCLVTERVIYRFGADEDKRKRLVQKAKDKIVATAAGLRVVPEPVLA